MQAFTPPPEGLLTTTKSQEEEGVIIEGHRAFTTLGIEVPTWIINCSPLKRIKSEQILRKYIDESSST